MGCPCFPSLADKIQNVFIRSKEDLIDITKEQLKAEQERNKIIENNLTIALNNNNNNNFFQNPQTLGDVTNPIRNTNDVPEDRPVTPNVVLFHDSLCKHINNTILSREGVTTTKVWAPNLLHIQEKVENMQFTDAIVIQSLTREVNEDSNREDVLALASETVDKCLQKSGKVVISSIIHREDDDTLGVKAEIVMPILNIGISIILTC